MLLTPNDLAHGDFVGLIVLLPGGHFRDDTQDVIMHESLSLVAIPLPGVLFVGLFLVGLLLFLVLFLGLGFLFAVIAYWTAYRSITSTFVAINYRQLCTLISIHLLLQSNVCNDLAEAMKALDGKKSKLGFVQAASFNVTGEDHFLESKKPMCLRPRK